MIPQTKILSMLGFHGWSRVPLRELQVACKRKIIEARRRGDDDLAARLSEIKQILKGRQHSRCVDCGEPCGSGGRGRAERCSTHSRIHRFYSKALAA